jgi:peroxisomal enoyl-CoA hydratase 2
MQNLFSQFAFFFRTWQALLYRLSGDYNPLHSDPSYAKAAGFPRPILHGLCTFGYATRAIIQLCCGGDPTLIQSVQGRFLLHVFPGETLVTEIWQNKKESVYVQSSVLTSIIVEYCLFCVFEVITLVLMLITFYG